MVGRKDSVNQNNYIEVSLSTADITTAQDDPDSEGIITIPSLEWDHCVTNMEDPLNPFYNKLYVNVNNIEPIVDRIVNLLGVKHNDTEVAWDDLIPVTQATTITLSSGQGIFRLWLGDANRYQFSWLITSSPNSTTVSANNFYCIINNATAVSYISLIDTDNQQWCRIYDPNSNDNLTGSVTFLRTAINLVNFHGE